DDFGVGQRGLLDAGGEVGHQWDAHELETGLTCGDGLERGGHADEVGPEDPGHAHLGGGFVVGAAELGVHALVEARIDVLGGGPHARGAEVGGDDGVGALGAGGAGEVDVIGDEPRGPGRPVAVEWGVADAGTSSGVPLAASRAVRSVARWPSPAGAWKRGAAAGGTALIVAPRRSAAPPHPEPGASAMWWEWMPAAGLMGVAAARAAA